MDCICIEFLSNIPQEKIEETGYFFPKVNYKKNTILKIYQSYEYIYSNTENTLFLEDFKNKREYLKELRGKKRDYKLSDKYRITDIDLIKAINKYVYLSKIMISYQRKIEEEYYVFDRKIKINEISEKTLLSNKSSYLLDKKY